jgi:hypothetical protein
MKKNLTKSCIILIIMLNASSLCVLSDTYAEQLTAQDQALSFMENVLPVDLSKYNITLTNHSTLDGVPMEGTLDQANTRVIDTVQYTLSSEQSTVEVMCIIEKNVMVFCQVYEKNGSIISDKEYTNLRDVVKSFLEKHQNYTKIDSTNLIATLDTVDITENSTTTTGDIKLTISNSVWAGDEITFFNWAYTVNGADYTSLQISFQKNGIIDTLLDNRAIYTIGDTSINVSKEQAIDIALKNLSSYSYKMPDQSMVSDFNVTEDNIVASLVTTPVDYELRPYWDIRMPLNQSYPGSVQGITAFLWANSGEIISYSNIAFGGVTYPDDSSDVESTPSTEDDTSLSANNTSLPDMIPAVGLAVAVIGLATAAILIKKRKK